MTEKRFILTEQFVTLQGVTFVKDDNAYVDTYYTVGEAVDLLNEQHEQIERLKRNFKALDEIKCELADENEQLKIDIGIIEDVHKLDREIIDDIHNEYQKIKEENKLLKEKLNEILELTEMNGMIHLRKAEIKSIIKR